MQQDSDLVRQLRTLATKRFGVGAAGLGADADLFEVLNIDSLAALDLLTDLEEHFSIEIPDWEIGGVNTLRGLAGVLEARL